MQKNSRTKRLFFIVKLCNTLRKEIENIASVSEENSASIEQVNASTQEMNRQMEQVLKLTHSLAETAADLQQMLGRFQLS